MLTDEIKKDIRSVLLSRVGGVPIAEFSKDYKKLVGSFLTPRHFGFSDLMSLLESIPDVARYTIDIILCLLNCLFVVFLNVHHES